MFTRVAAPNLHAATHSFIGLLLAEIAHHDSAVLALRAPRARGPSRLFAAPKRAAPSRGPNSHQHLSHNVAARSIPLQSPSRYLSSHDDSNQAMFGAQRRCVGARKAWSGPKVRAHAGNLKRAMFTRVVVEYFVGTSSYRARALRALGLDQRLVVRDGWVVARGVSGRGRYRGRRVRGSGAERGGHLESGYVQSQWVKGACGQGGKRAFIWAGGPSVADALLERVLRRHEGATASLIVPPLCTGMRLARFGHLG